MRKRAPKRAHSQLELPVTRPRVVVGDPFTEADVELVEESGEIESRTKARITIILAVALVAFYAVYMVHEWYVGNSLSMIGQFLQNAIVGFAAWCLGKGSSDRASP